MKRYAICALFFGMMSVCAYGMNDNDDGTESKVEGLEDLELGLVAPDDEQELVRGMVRELPETTQKSVLNRVYVLSMLSRQSVRSRAHHDEQKSKTEQLAYALNEELKVQIERNQLMVGFV
jgi:hypothetical protein